MDVRLTDMDATLGPISFAPMTASSRIDRGDRGCAEGASWTELLNSAPKTRHLLSWRPPWEPTSLDQMAASSRE